MTYFQAWRRWTESNTNGIVYQIFVLLGLSKSTTFEILKKQYGVK